MKKLLLLLCFLFLFFASNAQYPVTQFIGADSTLVKSRGGLQGRFAPIPFTDTAQANTSRIRQYPGALIYTSGVDKYWYRNSTMTGWVEFTSSGGATTNIYNSDGVLTGNRQLQGGEAYNLNFDGLGLFGVTASLIDLTSGGTTVGIGDSLVVDNTLGLSIRHLSSDNDTSTYKPLGYDPITGKVVTRSSWIGGGGGSGFPTKFDSLYTPLGGNRGSEYIVKSVRIRRNNITVNPTQIGDSAMYWNIDVPDSSTFATIYRTDTLSQNIRNEIAALPTPTLQQVLNEGNELSGFSYINATNSNTDYLLIGGGTYFYDIGLFAKRRLNFFTANGSSQDTASFFDLYQDSIQIKPWKGGLYIDSLNSGSATDSVLVWDASTGLVKKRNASAFSGGGGGVTTIGTINGTTKSANGGVISGSTLYLQTVDATYPGLMTSAQKARLDSNSYLTIDKTYDSLAWRRNDSTFLTKSLRIQLNGSTVTPTTTDSTLSYNIAGDTIPYSYNPSDWLVSLPHRSVPYFYTSGVAGDPTGSYYESSMYTPAPIHITNGTNKGKIFVVTKGDLNRKLFGWISSDKGFTWDTTGVVLSKSATGFDKDGVSMAHMIYDSLTNMIHMWYMGYSDSLYPSVFGVGYATASGDSPTVFTKQGQVLSGQSFATQIGMPHKPGYLKVSSVIKGRETGKYYFHGSYWIGNGTTWADSTIRLWQGVSSTISGNIDSCQQILAPTGTNTLLENPTVWYHDDGNYWMIYTNGYTDLNGGIDSVQYLQTAKTASLKNPNWVKQPGILFYPTKDSTWMGKRVYNAQLLKDGSGYYDRPISLQHDSLGRGVSNLYETQWMLFYSASYPNSYHDQSSIIRLTPQRSDLYTASIGFNGNIPNIIQKNGSMQVNIPFADTTRRYSGGITWEQIRDLYRSVKTGTTGRIAYYDSNMRRVRDLPTFSVTVGTYPTFTFGASGYSAASVYFRNSVGTTGMISEDAGMNYYASSTYMSHIWRDKVSGGIVLGKMWSSSGSPFAYFPGKTTFGSNNQATSHLQTDKTFAGIMSAAKTSAYTIADDYSIPCDATSAAFTVTLPQANGCPGRIYIIKKIDSSGNAVTVQGSGSEPIDASNTYALGTQWKYVVVQSTGSASTGWYIIGGN